MATLLDATNRLTVSPSGSLVVTLMSRDAPALISWLAMGSMVGGRFGLGVDVRVGTAVGWRLETRTPVATANVSVPSFSHTCSRIWYTPSLTLVVFHAPSPPLITVWLRGIISGYHRLPELGSGPHSSAYCRKRGWLALPTMVM